ncbi:uncharacterized protein PAC_10968 [Phialocephala subalpina]|uniref:AA1-like domain-containing protein n=1 Tax=Phialocephala subalpina TaxID=576137 RepID=A0A1L7X7S6_9HELO|nr:uncharacterized protein PAC_10968 [Phialocephala subalpina]
MMPQQYLTIVAFLVSFVTCFPHSRSSHRSNTLANTPEDPEYIVAVARTITIGNFISTISGFTVGNPGDLCAFIYIKLEYANFVRASTPTVTKPWNSECPIPSKFVINNFVSVSGRGGDVSFTITYGNDTYTCPVSGTEIFANRYYDVNCDNGSRVKVQTDGSSWISISEQFPCAALPFNYTSFGDSLFCDIDDAGVLTCLQLDPNIQIPVLHYEIGSQITS